MSRQWTDSVAIPAGSLKRCVRLDSSLRKMRKVELSTLFRNYGDVFRYRIFRHGALFPAWRPSLRMWDCSLLTDYVIVFIRQSTKLAAGGPVEHSRADRKQE